MARKAFGRRDALRMGWTLMATAAAGDLLAAETEPSLPAQWPEHPRLIVRKDDWTALERSRKTDAELDALVLGIVDVARRRLADAPLERVVTGRRLLGVSRAFISRVLLAAFAYRITGEAAFLERAKTDMLAVSAFTDWNPSHFLDVAEMTTGLALGYDWLYHDLSPETRATIRAAIVEKGLKPGSDPAKVGFYRMRNNWNQVCLAGMALGSMAVAEEEPELARQILLSVPKYNVNGLDTYKPDGIYPEGPGYWSYGTTFQMLLIEALKTAVGSDWGLLESPGLLKSADYLMHTASPSGRAYNFADSGYGIENGPAVFLIARYRNLPQMLVNPERSLRESLKTGRGLDRFLPLTPFWRPSTASRAGAPEPSRFWTGQGTNSLAIWRSAWNDPNARYFAIKAGGAAVSHGHMDGGSYILEWDGVRWAVDLGMQDYYSLEKIGLNLWDGKQEGERWKVFRLNNFSHNTLTIDNSLHNARTLSKLTAADANGATIDLLPIFLPGQATRAQRRVRLDDSAIVLEDELDGLKPGTPVRWAMATRAQVALDGARAHLTQEGKKLDIAFAPAELRVEDQSIEKPEGDWNAANLGVRLVTATAVADAEGRVRIQARFTR